VGLEVLENNMQTQNKKGKFIVIDGVGGSGKGTQISLLKEKFGDKIHFTREPGGSDFAEKVRELMLSEDARHADGYSHFSLVWSGRRDHVHSVIKQKINSGTSVVSDRFDSSTFAYQIFGQEQKDLEEIFYFVREKFLGEIKPDLYIFLEIPAEESVRRLKLRQSHQTHFHDQPKDYYERIIKGYQIFAEKYEAKIVDGNRSIEEVYQDILKLVEDVLD
jgi:dTMP kinase